MFELEEKGRGGRTHRNCERADSDLHASDVYEDRLDTASNDPIKASEGEGEGEDVFEDEETGEGFDGHVSFYMVSVRFALHTQRSTQE